MARRHSEGGRAPLTTDAVDLAMETEAGLASPSGASRRLLVNQNRLVKTQILSERAGLALKLLTGLAGFVVAALLAIVIWDAANTRSLVVEPFSVPADMAARGMTGQVVATRLLDDLGRLQSETVSYRAEESYGNWKNDIKVEIPQTGVSIGELQAFLRQWLGEETRISGEVVRTATGISVTARAGAVAGRTFTGTEDQLDSLIRKSALTVYGATQPERFAAWLTGKGQTDRARTVYEQISISGSRRQRAWAHAMLAQAAPTAAASKENAEMAVELDPDLPPAWFAMAAAAGRAGDPEGVLAANRRAATTLKGPRAREMAPWAALFHRKEQEGAAATKVGDLQTALARYLEASQPSPDQPAVACRNCGGGALVGAAGAAASNHDREQARRITERAVVVLGPNYAGLVRANTAITSALADRDWTTAILLMEMPGLRQTLASISTPESLLLDYDAAYALALASAGRIAEAERVVATCPAEAVPCLVTRAAIATARRDHAEAERLYTRAMERTPSIPSPAAYLAYARLERGDLAGALTAAREAQKRGPRSANPYKIEGDVHLARRDYAAAIKAYAKAADRAPTWGALHLQWARALRGQGKTGEAAAMERRARGMSLSRAEKKALGIA